jgi:hypothetical protein
MSALTNELESIPALLVGPLVELVKIIINAPNPADAIERAKFYALADAEKIAADELLKKSLP